MKTNQLPAFTFPTEGAEELGSHPDFPSSRVYYSRSDRLGFTSPLPSEHKLSSYYRTTYRENRYEAPTLDYLKAMGQRAQNQHDYILERSEGAGITNVLDVGCAAGMLLEAFQRDGARVTGFEPDEQMSQKARDKVGEEGKIHTKMFTPDMIAPGTMDLVVASHVLEHLPNPQEFVASLGKLLKPGGFLFIEVPNMSLDSVRCQVANRNVGHGHLYFFSPSSILTLFETVDFELVDVATYGPRMDWYIRFRHSRGKWNLYSRSLLGRVAGYGPWPWRVDGALNTRHDEHGVCLRCLARATPRAKAGAVVQTK